MSHEGSEASREEAKKALDVARRVGCAIPSEHPHQEMQMNWLTDQDLSGYPSFWMHSPTLSLSDNLAETGRWRRRRGDTILQEE